MDKVISESDDYDIDEGEYGIEDREGIAQLLEAGRSVEKGFTADDADPKELAVGIKLEMEHTTNPEWSKKIALDHIAEIPDYYTRLVKMEKDAGLDVSEYEEILQS